MSTVDFYVPSDLRDYAFLINRSDAAWSNAASRRSGGYSLYVWDGTQLSWAIFDIPGDLASKTIRVAINSASAVTTGMYMAFREATTVHLKVEFDIDAGKIRVLNGGGSVLQTWMTGFTKGIWNVYEFKMTIHDSTGSIAIKWQNTEILSLTNQDTRNGGTPFLDQFYIYCPASGGHAYIDDYATADDWIGPGTLIVKVPTADGTDTDWTASAGNKWDCVEEIPPAATEYIYADGGTGGTKYTADHGALAYTPAHIGFVAALAKARLNVAGSGKVRSILLATDDYTNGSDLDLSTTGQYLTAIAMTNPHTAAAWDKAGADAAEPGVETRV